MMTLALVRRCALSMVLALSLSGCSSYNAATLPAPRAHAEEREPITVRVGQSAKIVLHDGSEVSGEVVAVDAAAVTVGKVTNYGYVKTEIPAADIASLEVQTTPAVVSYLGSALGVATILMLGLFALVTSSGGAGWN